MNDYLINLMNPGANLQFPMEMAEPDQQISDQDLIQIEPYGLSIGQDMIRPVLIFKAMNGSLTMPVPINPLEAGVTLTQSNKSIAPVTPHKSTQAIFKALGIAIEKCVFVEIKGQYQYVKLFFSGNALTRSIKVRADEAMSLVLHLEVPIYTTKEFAARSKVITAELEDMKKDPEVAPHMIGRKPNYMN